jgi:hypothetical protein
MSTPILATKLYIPPPRPNVVHRSRLIERLNVGLQRTPSVTLISAPASFGKTTLVSEWVSTLTLKLATPVNFGDLIARNFKNVTPCKFNMPIFFWLLARMAFGWRKPKNNVLGSEFAGKVAAVGAQVTRFKPANMTFEQAAAAIELSSDQQWTQRALNDLQQSEDSGTKIRTFERSPRE